MSRVGAIRPIFGGEVAGNGYLRFEPVRYTVSHPTLLQHGTTPKPKGSIISFYSLNNYHPSNTTFYLKTSHSFPPVYAYVNL